MQVRKAVMTLGFGAAVAFAGAGLARSETQVTVPPDVEVEVRMLSFDRKQIQAIARTNSIDRNVVSALFASGVGELVAMPIIRTRPGTEASWKGVTEYIYPTSFGDQGRETTQVGTNGPLSAENGRTNSVVSETCVMPQDFATREVGTILTVHPELDSSRRIARINLLSQYVFEPTWRNYGVKTVPAKPPEPMEQPFFPVFAVSADVSMSSGSTALVGGGTPNSDGTKLFYVLVTVRLLDAEEKPVAK